MMEIRKLMTEGEDLQKCWDSYFKELPNQRSGVAALCWNGRCDGDYWCGRDERA